MSARDCKSAQCFMYKLVRMQVSYLLNDVQQVGINIRNHMSSDALFC